jgi:hypothetical protein
METNEIINEAKRKASLQKTFYSNLVAYIVVNGLLFLVNYLTAPGVWWVLYPVIGWGFMLIIHGIDTLLKIYQFWNRWESRKTEELIRKEQNR